MVKAYLVEFFGPVVTYTGIITVAAIVFCAGAAWLMDWLEF